MPLLLTSDFPSTANDAIVARILRSAAKPRVAWVPPRTSIGKAKFPAALERFTALGIATLDFCDVDQEQDESQLANLERYDVIYFTGGDPLVFRKNIEQSRIAPAIRDCLAMGRLVVGASGGAMQFTPNVSLYRLTSNPLDAVIAEHASYSALGLAPYELLPHRNRLDENFLANAQRYSGALRCDVVALDDGGAMIHEDDGQVRCVGEGIRFRAGVATRIRP